MHYFHFKLAARPNLFDVVRKVIMRSLTIYVEGIVTRTVAKEQDSNRVRNIIEN